MDSRRKILYVQYTNPAGYPPLEHSSRILAKNGWNVLFLGSGADGAATFRFEEHPNIEVRMLGFCRPGWRQKIHYLSFCLWVSWTVFRWKPSWIYASDPSACPAVLGASRFLRLPVIYHEHDSPAVRSRRGDSPFMQVIFLARKRLAKQAQACVLPNRRRGELFVSETGAPRVFCVLNCPRLEEVRPARLPRGDGLRVLYQGSLVPTRLATAVIEGLALLPENVTLTVIGFETVGHLRYTNTLRELARRLGVEGRVEFCGALKKRTEVLRRSSECDVGLSLIQPVAGDVNMDHMEGASNKPFDYLACGLAVLVPDFPAWKELFADPGYGLVSAPADPENIARVLRWFLEHPEETRAMGERGRQRILAEWNYEAQFAPVLVLMEQCMA